jgi:anti-sigma-K factor RskA
MADDDAELLELAYPYALDAVSESERRSIVERLTATSAATAEAFARIVADTRETMAIVTAVDALEPPADLERRIFAAIDEHPRASKDPSVQRAVRRRRLVRAAAAVAAVVIIGLGIAAVTGRFPWTSPPSGGPTVAQVLAASDVHTVTAAVAGGQVRIASSAHLNAAVVTMTDVPPPPAGHVYQLWLTPENGAPRSAGTMGPTSMPPPEGTVVGPLDAATTAGITVETGTGSTQPTGPRVATIPLT